MNSHFQTYSNLSSPHSPSPDDIRYTTLPPGHPGHIGVSGNSNGNINNGNCNGNNNMVHHQNHHHHNNNNSNNNNHHHHQNGHEQQIQIDNEQPNFHHLNNHNSNSQIKYCFGCGGKIVERYYLHALDRYWHNSCLKCYSCGALLGDIGSSCYTREGMILCKSDYIRMFGKAACSACGQIIAANEFVMRTTIPVSSQSQNQQQTSNQQQQQLPILPTDNNQKHFPSGQIEHHVFHLKCFACSKCSSQLRPGDKYYILAGSLVCEQDWHKLLLKNTTTTNPPVRKGKVGRPRRSRD